MAASFEYLDSFHNGLAAGKGALLDHCVHVVHPGCRPRNRIYANGYLVRYYIS
jgi:hypothetical protein